MNVRLSPPLTHTSGQSGEGWGHPPPISKNKGWQLAPNFGMIPLAGLSQTCLFAPHGWVYQSLRFCTRVLERWHKQTWPTCPWPPWGRAYVERHDLPGSQHRRASSDPVGPSLPPSWLHSIFLLFWILISKVDSIVCINLEVAGLSGSSSCSSISFLSFFFKPTLPSYHWLVAGAWSFLKKNFRTETF